MQKRNIPLIVILGPTACGKSDLGIQLARKFNGEVVSADSRQLYKDLDIGTAKVTKKEQRMVRHHLLDVVSAGRQFSLARYKKLADKAILDIWKRGKIPFLVGGSALYIKAVVDNYEIPRVKEDRRYRKKLEGYSLARLLNMLQKSDLKTFERIDKQNKRRVIRALEVFHVTGTSFSEQGKKGEDQYRSLLIGIDISREKLYRRIDARVDVRFRRGLIAEVQRLISRGISKVWLDSLGLEYRYVVRYLKGAKTMFEKKEMVQNLKFAIHDFVRRQLTWWRRDERIRWVKTKKEATGLVTSFLKLETLLLNRES